jgi:hypothetical protein
MEKTNRELLIKDISSRLPYGVKAEVKGWDENKGEEVFVPVTVYSVNTDGYVYFADNDYDITYCSIDACRLYLRPMFSMTEEEKEEWNSYITVPDGKSLRRMPYCIRYMDWLISHHFDFRGLIPMGLALKAPEDMYKV